MSGAIHNRSSFCCVPLLAQHWLRELKKYDFDLPSIIWQGGYIKWNTPYFARFITVNSCSFTKMAVFESFSKQITQRYVQSYIHTRAPTKVLTLTCFLHEVKVHCVYHTHLLNYFWYATKSDKMKNNKCFSCKTCFHSSTHRMLLDVK